MNKRNFAYIKEKEMARIIGGLAAVQVHMCHFGVADGNCKGCTPFEHCYCDGSIPPGGGIGGGGGKIPSEPILW